MTDMDRRNSNDNSFKYQNYMVTNGNMMNPLKHDKWLVTIFKFQEAVERVKIQDPRNKEIE